MLLVVVVVLIADVEHSELASDSSSFVCFVGIDENQNDHL